MTDTTQQREAHALTTMQTRWNEAEGLQQFRSVCVCGWASMWMTTNACQGRGRRHVAATRRKGAVR